MFLHFHRFLRLTFYRVFSGNKPVSPYSGYNGQIRSSVYQPTELAIITNVSTSIYHPCFAYANPHGNFIIQLSDDNSGDLKKPCHKHVFISDVCIALLSHTHAFSFFMLVASAQDGLFVRYFDPTSLSRLSSQSERQRHPDPIQHWTRH